LFKGDKVSKNNNIPTFLVITRGHLLDDIVPVYTDKSRQEIFDAIQKIDREKAFELATKCETCDGIHEISSERCDACWEETCSTKEIIKKMKSMNLIKTMDGPAQIRIYNKLEVD
jgi:hypothetical protein